VKVKYTRHEWICEIATNREAEFAFHFAGWGSIQLGIHIDWLMKNVEIFLPFCWLSIGYKNAFSQCVEREVK